MDPYQSFVEVHKSQLLASQVPKGLWKTLYGKLRDNVFDIGEKAALVEASPYQLTLTAEELKKDSDIFLVDHAWTTTIVDCLEQLERVPGLLDRVERMIGYEASDANQDSDSNGGEEDIDEGSVRIVASQAHVSEERARELLKQYNGEIIEAISNASAVKDTNQIAALKKHILGQMRDDDERNTQHWVTERYRCDQYTTEDEGQVIEVTIPLYQKPQSRDVSCDIRAQALCVHVFGKEIMRGDLHGRVSIDDSLWTIEDDGSVKIMLVKVGDDLWPELLRGEKRIDVASRRRHIEGVFSKLWGRLQAFEYTRKVGDRGNAFERNTVWYLMDEAGSAITHSDDPTCRCSPFLYFSPEHQTVVAFSLVWPCKDMAQGDLFTRDYCPPIINAPQEREAYLYAAGEKGDEARFAGAYRRLVEADEKVAREAHLSASLQRTKLGPVRAGPAPMPDIPYVYVDTSHTDTDRWDKKAQFHLTRSADAADLVFYSLHDILAADRPAIKGSALSNASILARKTFANNQVLVNFIHQHLGKRPWVSEWYDLPMQLQEFVGSALVSQSHWMVYGPLTLGPVNDKPIILTSDYRCAVRHLDVGYVTAEKYVPSSLHHIQQYHLEYFVLVDQFDRIFVFDEIWASYWRIPLDHQNHPLPYSHVPEIMEIPIQEMLTQVKSVCKAHIEDARESILAIIKETFSAAILATKVEDKSCNEFGLFMVKIGMSNFDFATSKQSAQPQPYLENVFVVDGQRIPNYGNLLAATISVLSASGQGNTDAGDVDGWVRL